MLKIMDEVLHDLQSAQAYQRDVTSKSGNDVDVTQMSQTFAFNNSLIFYLNRTHSFATHIIASS